MNIPEPTEVQRYAYKPGDRIIAYFPAEVLINAEVAWEISRQLHEAMELPPEVPVVVMPDDARIEVIEGGHI